MRDPVSLPLLPRSNLQPHSLRREDEADPGNNYKSVSYRYVEPQIYSVLGVHMHGWCRKCRSPGGGAGGLCRALCPGGAGGGSGGTRAPGAAALPCPAPAAEPPRGFAIVRGASRGFSM